MTVRSSIQGQRFLLPGPGGERLVYLRVEPATVSFIGTFDLSYYRGFEDMIRSLSVKMAIGQEYLFSLTIRLHTSSLCPTLVASENHTQRSKSELPLMLRIS